ncbi:MAG TPA: hypothetical protein VMU77_04975, partial [Acidimicrobiales bacterium]|nr:hypothetical protein [Acidimicrobiales bacterium]
MPIGHISIITTVVPTTVNIFSARTNLAELITPASRPISEFSTPSDGSGVLFRHAHVGRQFEKSPSYSGPPQGCGKRADWGPLKGKSASSDGGHPLSIRGFDGQALQMA